MTARDPELVPVDPRDDYFVVSEDWLTSDLPFPDASDRERLKDIGFTTRAAIVRLDHRPRKATIFVPPAAGRQHFAWVDGISMRATAQGRIDDDDVGPQHIERYLQYLHHRFGQSEAMTPETMVPIVGGFVEPQLALPPSRAPIAWGALREGSNLIVSGPAGSGKTSLVRHWLLWYAERNRRGETDLLPICLPLREMQRADTIEIALGRQALEAGAPWLQRDLLAYAQDGKLAIAFDGLDEVPAGYLARVADGIAAFIRTFPECRYLVSTRPEAFLTRDLAMTRAELLPFDAGRMRQFIYHRLCGAGSWADAASRVSDTGNPMMLAHAVAHAGDPMRLQDWDFQRGIARN